MDFCFERESREDVVETLVDSLDDDPRNDNDDTLRSSHWAQRANETRHRMAHLLRAVRARRMEH